MMSDCVALQDMGKLLEMGSIRPEFLLDCFHSPLSMASLAAESLIHQHENCMLCLDYSQVFVISSLSSICQHWQAT